MTNQTVRDALGDRLRTAMRDRDRDAVAGLRLALAALDNAGAVPTEQRAGAVESAVIGAGAADVPRRELHVADELAVVAAEATGLRESGRAAAAAILDAAIAEIRAAQP